MEVTPDHVPCRHCGASISWDEVCWVHDDTGFATCGVVMSGGITDGYVTYNPNIEVVGPHKGRHAEPIGEWK